MMFFKFFSNISAMSHYVQKENSAMSLNTDYVFCNTNCGTKNKKKGVNGIAI